MDIAGAHGGGIREAGLMGRIQPPNRSKKLPNEAGATVGNTVAQLNKRSECHVVDLEARIR